MKFMSKVACILVILNNGCVSGPSPEEMKTQNAKANAGEAESQDEVAFLEASDSRAELNKFIKKYPDSPYVKQAKAKLDASIDTVTICVSPKIDSVVKKGAEEGAFTIQGQFVIPDKTFTVGKSTKKEIQSLLGHGLQKWNLKSGNLEAYVWNAVSYKKGNYGCGLSGLVGVLPLGALAFYFDAGDVLREIHEID